MRINLDIDDAEVLDAFNRILRAGQDMEPVMRDVGEALLNSTRERFNSQTAPDGSPWAPLSETTKQRKKRNRDKVLTEHGDLRRDISYRVGPDFVEVGSSRIYGGTHQFGAERGAYGETFRGSPIPWGDIPARPFLGVSDDDARAIDEIVIDHLADAITRSI
ncbi:MAG: phage virion morphogenesis protein [Gammaproteobacteria bacterium]|nr:phage virion morphogenesis protein [Gammaproteobacteria bacterium]MYF30200.1 phage virion morphogenesis protein [Gammaproteobacteria bacterium]